MLTITKRLVLGTLATKSFVLTNNLKGWKWNGSKRSKSCKWGWARFQFIAFIYRLWLHGFRRQGIHRQMLGLCPLHVMLLASKWVPCIGSPLSYSTPPMWWSHCQLVLLCDFLYKISGIAVIKGKNTIHIHPTISFSHDWICLIWKIMCENNLFFIYGVRAQSFKQELF